jgi:hypothetical protein
MATTFVIACPDCAKQVKVSDEHVGKRIKCKGCGTVYPVKAPEESAAPAKTQVAAQGSPRTKVAPTSGKPKAPPGVPKPKAAPPPPPKPTVEAQAPLNLADDPEYDPNDYSLAKTNDALPRCPFCANELESLEARICLHCGYNTRTRIRPDVKQVYAHSGLELFVWWLPAIIAILVMIGMVIWYVVFWNLIEDWLTDSWFEDEPGPPRTFIGGLGPGFMRLYLALFTIFCFVPMIRFTIKRLVWNNKPPETRIKDEWER